ncbi:MAG: ATP-dependent DNA helicase [Chitinophagales bacterium]
MQKDLQYEEAFSTAYASLNDAQRAAVDKIEGPVLVVAGPGTGKTQILAVRIGAILQRTDTYPENILCLTYTDAGTIAMRKRLQEFIGPDAYRVHIHTFHAFCNEVIQSNIDYFGKRELEPISELENVGLLESILNDLPDDHVLKRFKGELNFEATRLNNLFRLMKEEDWNPQHIHTAIDAYVSSLPERDDFIYKRANSKQGIKPGDPKQHLIDAEIAKMEKLAAAADLFPQYVQRMRDIGRYDYSDMILWVVQAFKDNTPQAEHILRNYQERFLYFLVDEFQDTNGAQNEILQQLISYWDVPNVFAVGDDDQSIYEFQGARMKNILDFYHRYQENIDVVILSENYRSHQAILDASRVVIENNNDRLIHALDGLTKELIAAHPERQHIHEPALDVYENPLQEQAGILAQIETLIADGVAPQEIAVIYYRHAQAEDLISVCEKKGIPYQVKKKINVLDEMLVRQLITILNYLDEEHRRPHSGEYHLFQIMHYSFFGIHPQDVASIAAWISGKRDEKYTWRAVLSDPAVLAQIKLRDHEAILRFEKIITHWISETYSLTVQILFEKIMNESGLLPYILTGPDRVWKLELVTTFFNHIKSEGQRVPRISISQYLEVLDQMDVHGIKIEINKSVVHTNGVQFITAHSAKGLEFEYVFLMGCTKDKWESARGGNSNFGLPDTLTFSSEENKIESMRRLFYVAVTRAKQHLHISWSAHDQNGKDTDEVRFIAELKNGTGLIPQARTVDDNAILDFMAATLSLTPEVRIDLFDKAFIAQRLENFVMSASALNTYLDCSLTFYFERVIRVPAAKNDSMAFGTAVHFALRRLYERMHESEKQEFPPVHVFIHDFEYSMQRNADAFTEKQFENRIALGKKVLTAYYARYADSFPKVVLTEYPVRHVTIQQVPVTGVFDKLEFNGNDVHVVDYKTGKVERGKLKLRAPNDKDPLGGDYWRQLVFYKMLIDAQKYKPWKMLSGEIDFIEPNEKGEFVKQTLEIHDGDVEVVKDQIVTVYKKIMDMDFSPGCGKEDCMWCNFVRQYYSN